MNRRLLLGLLAVSVFVLAAYGSQLVTRQPVTRTVAVAEPEPLPVAPPIPLVPVQVQNFPVDDDGNLRVSEQGNNETPKKVEVVNLGSPNLITGSVSIQNFPPTQDVRIVNQPLEVTQSPRTLLQGHTTFNVPGGEVASLLVPAGAVLTDARLTGVFIAGGPPLGASVVDSGGIYVAELPLTLQTGIMSDGTLTVRASCAGGSVYCLGTMMWTGYMP